MPKRKRDYKAEYRRRIERGLKKGLSHSQARGHPKAGEALVSTGLKTPESDAKLEAAVKRLREGNSQSAAAKNGWRLCEPAEALHLWTQVGQAGGPRMDRDG